MVPVSLGGVGRRRAFPSALVSGRPDPDGRRVGFFGEVVVVVGLVPLANVCVVRRIRLLL